MTTLKPKLNAHLFTAASDEWGTPQDLFDELHREFKFDIDLCASKENAKLPRYFTKEQNSLSQPWHLYGASGFCNPPYGADTALFMEKAFEESWLGFTTVLLVKAATDTMWWHEFVEPMRAGYPSDVRFIQGRLKFVDADTQIIAQILKDAELSVPPRKPEPATFPSVVVEFRARQLAARGGD